MQICHYYCIFYIGRATISYPREGQRIPFNGSCIVGGEPKPHLLTLGALEDVLNPFARTCIATNYHINPPREVETRHHIINYYGMLFLKCIFCNVMFFVCS